MKLLLHFIFICFLLISCESDEIEIQSIHDSELVEGFDYDEFPLIKKGIDESGNGKYYEAITTFKKAKKEYGDHKALYLNMGTTYGAIENYPKAIESLTKCLNLDNNYVAALLNRGLYYGYNYQYIKAEKDLQKAITLSPKEPACFINLCVIYGFQGENDKSCMMIEKAIELGGIKKYGNQLIQLKEKYCK